MVWVLEKGPVEAPWYYTETEEWSKDPQQALHFASKKAAEDVNYYRGRPLEHDARIIELHSGSTE